MGKEDQFDPTSSLQDSLDVAATAISPVFPVIDIDAAVAHYEELGFEAEYYPGGGYAFVRAGRTEIHLTKVPDLDPSTSTSACFIYVQDADALYERWEQAEIEGQLVPPTDTEYGIREFAHIDIDGNLIRVGSSLA